MSASNFFHDLAASASRQPVYERQQTLLDTPEKVDDANKHLRMLKVREGNWYRLGDIVYRNVPLPFKPMRINTETRLIDTIRP